MGLALFDEQAIEQRLADLALPRSSPLSVIAVELLPSDHLAQHSVTFGDRQIFYTTDQPDLPFGAALTGFVGTPAATNDPLGAELGSIASRRILRCSPLTPVAPAC